MTKTLLKNDGRVFVLRPDQADKPPIIEQSTPKQDYLFCPDCEKYFGLLETTFANKVYRPIHDVRHSKQFGVIPLEVGRKYKVCLNVDPVLIQLFVQSIVWRGSVAGDMTFKHFNVGKDNEEGLRVSLLSCKSLKSAQLYELIKTAGNVLYKGYFQLITYEGHVDGDKNLIYIFTNKTPIVMILNEYILTYSFDETTHSLSIFGEANEIPSSDNIRIGVDTPDSWANLSQTMLRLLHSESMYHLAKDSKKPFIPKDKRFAPRKKKQ